MATDWDDGDIVYDTHWLSLKRALAGNAIVSGMGVTEDAPASMDVIVAAGVYYSAGAREVYAGGTITIDPADPADDRWDLISGGPAGLTYTAGVPGVITVPPNLPSADDIVIALVKVPTGAVTIVNANIYSFNWTNLILEHASRHNPSGDDHLATGVPSDIGTVNAEGTANAYARQDHIHKIPALGITTGLIDDLAVTAAKIALLTITAAQIANATITDVQIAAANKDGVAGLACMRTLGIGAAQACAGNDARLSDPRTPVVHDYSLHTDRARKIGIDIFGMRAIGATPIAGSIALGGGGATYYGWEFANADTDYILCSGEVPYDRAGSTLELWVCLAAAGFANVRMDARAHQTLHASSDPETTCAQTCSTSGGTATYWFSLGTFTITSNYGWQIRLRRNATHVGDTYAASIWLVGMFLQYTADM